MKDVDRVSQFFNYVLRNSVYGVGNHPVQKDHQIIELKNLLSESIRHLKFAFENIDENIIDDSINDIEDFLKNAEQYRFRHNITIYEQTFDTWDCDCCGYVTDGSFKVSIGDDMIEHFHDGHFGGGDWDGTDYGMYGLLLADLFDAHYTHVETDDIIHSMGYRRDLRGLYGDDMDKALELSPNKIVDVKIFEAWDKSYNFSVKFHDIFNLEGNIPFGECNDGTYEWEGSLICDIDMDNVMQFIFEKVCECLGIVIESA